MKFRKILTDIVVEQRWGQQGGDATQIFTKGFIPDVKPQTDKISKSSTPTSSGNSKKVIDYFISKGLEPHQAAGIAANFEAESNFNPSAIGDNGKSHGLAQWRDSRWNNLQNFAKDEGKKWNDFNVQLDFAWDEMVSSYPEMLSDLRSSKDFNEATKVVMLQYEIPSDQSTAAINKRQKIAKKYFESSGTSSTSNEELRSYFSDPLDTMIKPSGVGVWKAPRSHGKHDGIDIGAPKGSPIYSIMSGNITAVHNSGRCGNGLTITNGDWAYTFCHANRVYKKSGSVSKGEKVGEVGETGSATGPHLHFKITYKGKPIDPTPYFF